MYSFSHGMAGYGTKKRHGLSSVRLGHHGHGKPHETWGRFPDRPATDNSKNAMDGAHGYERHPYGMLRGAHNSFSSSRHSRMPMMHFSPPSDEDFQEFHSFISQKPLFGQHEGHPKPQTEEGKAEDRGAGSEIPLPRRPHQVQKKHRGPRDEAKTLKKSNS
ncbi:hypothetical protein TGRUB_215960 [Toxoplasma gondii RUB]|uniref:Uncharacterized protein n=3 Tax=Toxoplasma gondii TaxID=5811 RepID=A0A086LNY0_TOXGO|nr:hypothetical protein TGP89_215960 [Toxoplasma gondii p89]KFG58348.1 hypothetical protein TGRUB_215960 [Toxoplasma gondii RUB]RQX67334.1 hypothetical protein TGCAST_215960 [Toxoplasma gondii CAST]